MKTCLRNGREGKMGKINNKMEKKTSGRFQHDISMVQMFLPKSKEKCPNVLYIQPVKADHRLLFQTLPLRNKDTGTSIHLK